MEESGTGFPIRVAYDADEDTLTFNFTTMREPGVAEEAADEVWVRYDPDTRRVITVDVLNFSKRVQGVFGPNLLYTERTDPQRIKSLATLPLADETN
jgi:hypothetical protein